MGYNNKLKNKLFGLLCEFEKGREWEKFLDTIVIELLGQKEELNSINYWSLLGKVQSLRFLSYEYFALPTPYANLNCVSPVLLANPMYWYISVLELSSL